MFQILKRDKKSRARLGVLRTAHGAIETPSYVIVATEGKIKCLKPSDIKKTKTQIVIANTYHLWDRPKNVRSLLGVKMPTMTDSGGFQVFSLGFGEQNRVGKIMKEELAPGKQPKRQNTRVTSKGVYFKTDHDWKFLSPEISIQIQKKLGADIIFAFDEPTSPLDSFKYNQAAMKRTHDWAVKCLKEFYADGKPKQMLFGIVQGGKFKSLREQSAKFIGSLPFDGFGIGGSYTKEQIEKALKWIIPHLPEEKPRHLLGIGKIEDIFTAVENGIDFFDCVIPTREARHGRLWTKSGHFDIRKTVFANDKKVIERGCGCPTCKNKISRAKLHGLFRNPGKIGEAPYRMVRGEAKRFATLHNVWFFNNLLEQIRNSLCRGRFQQFKKKFLR